MLIIRCVWNSLFIVYLNLSFLISTFDKNYRCLEELIKISYDSCKLILTYFNKFYEKAYKKKFIEKPKNRSSY